MQVRKFAVLLCAGASPLAAQRTTGLVPCRGQRIDSISIDAQAPTVAGLRRVPVVGNVVRETHVVTRDEIIRRFLLLHVRGRCSELRRAESERILRAQPFIADANIDVVGNARGGVNLEIHTIDEASFAQSNERMLPLCSVSFAASPPSTGMIQIWASLSAPSPSRAPAAASRVERKATDRLSGDHAGA